MTSPRTEAWRAQIERWPAQGRHVLAQFDDDTVVVYQAFRPSIGHAAAAEGRLGGGGFSFERMSWIKPNFLWMMFRSGWGTKVDQEVTLAVTLRREGFDAILAAGLWRASRRPAPRLLGLLAGAAAIDAALSVVHVAEVGLGAGVAAALRTLAVAAPVVGTVALAWARHRARALDRGGAR